MFEFLTFIHLPKALTCVFGFGPGIQDGPGLQKFFLFVSDFETGGVICENFLVSGSFRIASESFGVITLILVTEVWGDLGEVSFSNLTGSSGVTSFSLGSSLGINLGTLLGILRVSTGSDFSVGDLSLFLRFCFRGILRAPMIESQSYF